LRRPTVRNWRPAKIPGIANVYTRIQKLEIQINKKKETKRYFATLAQSRQPPVVPDKVSDATIKNSKTKKKWGTFVRFKWFK
jgi:hypothetical protein